MHFLSTTEGPSSSYSCRETQFCWKVPRDAAEKRGLDTKEARTLASQQANHVCVGKQGALNKHEAARARHKPRHSPSTEPPIQLAYSRSVGAGVTTRGLKAAGMSTSISQCMRLCRSFISDPPPDKMTTKRGQEIISRINQIL